jgi:hypothetical protein
MFPVPAVKQLVEGNTLEIIAYVSLKFRQFHSGAAVSLSLTGIGGHQATVYAYRTLDRLDDLTQADLRRLPTQAKTPFRPHATSHKFRFVKPLHQFAR